MKQHPFLSVLAAMLTGFALGIASDFIAGRAAFTFDNIVSALILSPILVCIAAGVADDSPFQLVFLVGGCLFWPVFGLLAWQWFRTKRTAFIAAIALWSAQGCFQIIARLEVVSSA